MITVSVLDLGEKSRGAAPPSLCLNNTRLEGLKIAPSPHWSKKQPTFTPPFISEKEYSHLSTCWGGVLLSTLGIIAKYVTNFYSDNQLLE